MSKDIIRCRRRMHANNKTLLEIGTLKIIKKVSVDGQGGVFNIMTPHT